MIVYFAKLHEYRKNEKRKWKYKEECDRHCQEDVNKVLGFPEEGKTSSSHSVGEGIC